MAEKIEPDLLSPVKSGPYPSDHHLIFDPAAGFICLPLQEFYY